ncbi:hypothetical protein VTK26DRAFT_9029 [Humicola hyalothermophila]
MPSNRTRLTTTVRPGLTPDHSGILPTRFVVQTEMLALFSSRASLQYLFLRRVPVYFGALERLPSTADEKTETELATMSSVMALDHIIPKLSASKPDTGQPRLPFHSRKSVGMVSPTPVRIACPSSSTIFKSQMCQNWASNHLTGRTDPGENLSAEDV